MLSFDEYLRLGFGKFTVEHCFGWMLLEVVITTGTKTKYTGIYVRVELSIRNSLKMIGIIFTCFGNFLEFLIVVAEFS